MRGERSRGVAWRGLSCLRGRVRSLRVLSATRPTPIRANVNGSGNVAMYTEAWLRSAAHAGGSQRAAASTGMAERRSVGVAVMVLRPPGRRELPDHAQRLHASSRLVPPFTCKFCSAIRGPNRRMGYKLLNLRCFLEFT